MAAWYAKQKAGQLWRNCLFVYLFNCSLVGFSYANIAKLTLWRNCVARWELAGLC